MPAQCFGSVLSSHCASAQQFLTRHGNFVRPSVCHTPAFYRNRLTYKLTLINHRIFFINAQSRQWQDPVFSHAGTASYPWYQMVWQGTQRIIILVFAVLNIFAKFWRSRLLRGRWIEAGYINFAIFDQYRAICGKRYKIGQLPWNGNRKSHALYRIVTFPVTLDDLWRSFQWSTCCCCWCAQLTRDLLAIAKFLVFTRLQCAAVIK